MRVPIRKGDKFTNIKPDPNLTQAKYDELKANLDKLIKHVRPTLAKEVQRLAEMGDFSENHAYSLAKGKLRGINQRIIEIENHLKTAVIIGTGGNKETVQLGCQVTVFNLQTKKEKTYLILGSAETDPLGGVISHNSPIGQALMGKKVGETAKVKLTNKEVTYRVDKIF